MRVIFKQDVKPYKKDELAEVADGYALNYLIPNKYAVVATEKELKELAERQAELVAADEEKLAYSESVVKKLREVTFTFKLKKSPSGTPMGSVTAKEICDTINGMYPSCATIKPNQLSVKKLDTFGEHDIHIKLYKMTAMTRIFVEEE